MPAVTHELKVQDVTDWMMDIDQAGSLEWLVQGVIPVGGVCLLSGQQKRAMKTFSSIDMAVSIATGQPFGGAFETKQGKVLIIAEEGSKFAYKDRLDASLVGHGQGRGVLQNRMFISFRSMVKLDSPAWRDAILRAADTYEPDLIIFDSLYRMFEGDENKQEDANRALDTLMKLGAEQFASLVICHLDKTRGASQKQDIDDQVRGSGVITNGYDSHIALRRYDSKVKPIDLIVRPRESEEFERSVVWDLKKNNGRIFSSVMQIKEKVGASGKATNKDSRRSNGVSALPTV